MHPLSVLSLAPGWAFCDLFTSLGDYQGVGDAA